MELVCSMHHVRMSLSYSTLLFPGMTETTIKEIFQSQSLKNTRNTFHPVKGQLRSFIRVARSNIFVQTQKLEWKKLRKKELLLISI